MKCDPDGIYLIMCNDVEAAADGLMRQHQEEKDLRSARKIQEESIVKKAATDRDRP